MKRGGHKEEKFLQRFFFANSQICFFLGVNIQGVDHAEEQCPWQNKFDFGWVLMPRINVREGPMQGSQNLMSQSQPCSVSEASPPSLLTTCGSHADLSLSLPSLVLSEDLTISPGSIHYPTRPRLSLWPSSTLWHSVPMREKLPQIPQIRFLPHRPFYRLTRLRYLDFRQGEKSQISLKDLLCFPWFHFVLLYFSVGPDTFLRSAWPWLCVYLFSTPNWLSPSMSGVHWPSWSV